RATDLTERDEIFDVSPMLAKALASSSSFRSVATIVPSSLGKCKSIASFKSADKSAVLHIVTCVNVRGQDTALMHVDSSSGVSEAFRLIGRTILGSTQSPYAIHNLLEDQSIPTGYRLK